jgi:hypothetical protein
MKKIIAIAAIALAATAITPAQTPPTGTAPAVTAQETVKVEGKLALINGRIGVKQGDKTYYLNNVDHLAGFIEGFKEGSSVKLEGYAVPLPAAPEYVNLMVTKLTVGGKDYDLSQCVGMPGGRGMGNANGDDIENGAGKNGVSGNRGGMMGGRR